MVRAYPVRRCQDDDPVANRDVPPDTNRASKVEHTSDIHEGSRAEPEPLVDVPGPANPRSPRNDDPTRNPKSRQPQERCSQPLANVVWNQPQDEAGHLISEVQSTKFFAEDSSHGGDAHSRDGVVEARAPWPTTTGALNAGPILR